LQVRFAASFLSCQICAGFTNVLHIYKVRTNYTLSRWVSELTYYLTSNWKSKSFTTTKVKLPSIVQNVSLEAATRRSTVTWSGVEGATGYIVVVEWYTKVYETGGQTPFIWAREVKADTTSFTYDRKFTRASVLAIGDDRKAFTPLDKAFDVKPSGTSTQI